ncbi:DUF6528 family protein [Parapedobacter indicus]|uniref:Uncharacterized protein n=1 Tax=Parapedobacter indicus TaxID=1477437 RepID=A0A1I3IK02_9SPHI|nr:DUF6528 family protein [Parapedobacter indicus]PPL02202.1 hypothetical protein CLV26_104127 [Parapedobacter indicus]SFI48355.1 hypothetical protein SAMN05444682_104127 [Parapedobacter indicus]
MKIRFTIITGFLLLALAPLLIAANEASPFRSGDLVVCGDDKIRIYDGEAARSGDATLVWSWQASEAKGQLPEEYFGMLRSLDDCKPVQNNTQLLITSSSGATLLLDVATKRVLFYAQTPMAHSADLLPKGRIAVANSTHAAGNSLELYDERESEKVLYKDTLYSGHGAVWVAERQELFALGFDSLLVYRQEDWHTNNPRLEKVHAYPLPDGGGHELSPTSSGQLLVSTHHHVWLADMKTGTFTLFEPLKDHENIKSANYDATTGALVYTVAEESWWTHHVYGVNPDFRIEIPDMRAYKVRVVR